MIGLIISIFKLFLSGALGGILGYERKQRNRTGFRMLILIAVGSTAFAIASIHVGDMSAAADPGLIVALAVLAIGVLGGAVLFTEQEKSNGMRTAVSVWTAGAAGILVGVGLVIESVVFTGLAYYILRYLPALFNNNDSEQGSEESDSTE
ncbi:MAG: MgtC/SapB family protein [Candidatus Marinimicrobia bacterium]|nr:MgtC/SapB family protein [Candidatus Neomarinimicrobiota bacterium]MCF7828252.1 MgtC/SapB family protein [Candidatus Neomarinimicrobiota bacterium]MCF7879573.1 MgtC/SapB family protein [Candidatus Neomarinimicrobiota bacterium]